MFTAIRTELLKIRTTRLTPGLIAVAAGLTAMVVILEVAQAGTGGTGATSIPSLSTSAGLRDVLTNTGFAMLVATVFGATVSSGEFRHRTATDTYLDQPDRIRVLTAKLIAATVTGLLFGLVATIITTGVGLGGVAAKGYRPAVSTGDIVAYSAGAMAGCALMAAIGVAVGALVRQQLGALIAIFVWTMAIEQIFSRVWPSPARFFPLLSATTMAGADNIASMPPVPPDLKALAPGMVAVVLITIAAFLAVAASIFSVRKDITSA
jgi:ABC-type transport system involved in multi-copper enzyme maturation permease subunit